MKSKFTTIYIVRHGESAHNRDGLIGGGPENPPLTGLGREQAHHVKDKLSHIQFDVAYSSDLDRAIDTASIIHGQDVLQENRLIELRERTFGILDGQAEGLLAHYAETKLAQPHQLRRHYVHAEGMESDHVLAERYISILTKIATNHPGKTVLIGAHGSAIRTTLIELGWATYEEFPSGTFSNGAYARLIFDGALTVEEVVNPTHKFPS